MKSIILSSILVFSGLMALQAQQIDWLKYHEEPSMFSVRSSDLNSNGDVIFCGIKKPAYWGFPTLANNYVSQYDSLGNYIFNHEFTGKLHINHVKFFDGNHYLICGLIDDQFNFDNVNIIGTKVFCSMISNSGDLVWIYTDSTITSMNSRLAVNANNEIIFSAGNTNGIQSTGKIIVLNEQGDTTHTELFYNAMASDIDVDLQGNIYLASMGFVWDTVFFDDIFSPDTSNIGMMKNLLIKYDSDFSAQWIYESHGDDGDIHPGISTSDNGVYWYRRTWETSITNVFPVISHIDLNGQLQNEKIIGVGVGPNGFKTWDVYCKNNYVQILFENNDSYVKTYDISLNPVDSFSLNRQSIMSFNGTNTFLSGTIHTNQTLTFENGQSLPGPVGTVTDTVFLAYISSPTITNVVNHKEYGSCFTVYPNPAREKIWIKTEENQKEIAISIYSIFGERVLLKNGDTEIDIRSLTIGPYFVEIVNNEKKEVFKILKIE